MKFLFSVAVLSILTILFALTFPAWSDLLLIAIPSAVASIFLGWRRWWSGDRRGKIQGGKRKWAIVDGSNIMHWRDGEPGFEALHDVIRRLKALGFAPGVMFDANAGYLLAGHYLDDGSMAKRLKLREDAVVVVAKGSPADPVILTAARDLGAIVVSNDRYRDWAEAYPEVKTPGTLVRGGYRSGHLWLECEAEQAEKGQGAGKR